jgi:hypothetical protein
MKKSEKKFTLSNRWLYTLISFGILSLFAVGVYAYGTASPSVFGHSAGEIDLTGASLNGVGNIVSSGYVHGSISGGNGNLASSFYEISGTNIGGQTIYSYGSMCVGNSGGDCAGSGGTVITSSTIGVGGTHSLSAIYTTGKSYGVISTSSNTGVYGYGPVYNFLASGAGGTNYGAESSIRWKNNISEIPNALSKILALRGVYYN